MCLVWSGLVWMDRGFAIIPLNFDSLNRWCEQLLLWSILPPLQISKAAILRWFKTLVTVTFEHLPRLLSSRATDQIERKTWHAPSNQKMRKPSVRTSLQTSVRSAIQQYGFCPIYLVVANTFNIILPQQTWLKYLEQKMLMLRNNSNLGWA
jgi:hypothetical protein